MMSATLPTANSLDGDSSSSSRGGITSMEIENSQQNHHQLPQAADMDTAMELPFQPNEPLPNSNHHHHHQIAGSLPVSAATSTANFSFSGNANGGVVLGGINNTTTTNLNTTTLMQSSPPPHSYRHSRAYRHFKNPPQPHMCIRTTTEVGEELFINVLSWTRIVIPQEPSDPIPLYGGMRVPPGSPRSPPIVFAVMANPEVLKDSGRHSKDPEERRAMVELMCDFVEAMNPGVKLVRNAVILKDRDISGELKDVWNAVQAQRDREREEQMMQQRQQQHYHNLTTQQMFPKSGESTIVAGSKQQQQQGGLIAGATGNVTQKSEEETSSKAKATSETEANAGTATTTNVAATTLSTLAQQLDNKATVATAAGTAAAANGDADGGGDDKQRNNAIAAIVISATELNGDMQAMSGGQATNAAVATPNSEQNGSCDQIDANLKMKNVKDKNESKQNSSGGSKQKSHSSNAITASNTSNSTKDNPQQNANSKTTIATTPTSPTAQANASPSGASTMPSATPAAVTPASAPTPAPAPTKKEKLGGFLPNGCIFPRFKNNKHKDKDKDSKPKEKEKTLLNALKKSKEKKIAPIERTTAEKNSNPSTTAVDVEAKTQYEKNCINLESEVEKLDLNKIDSSTNNENMFIKLKVSTASSAAATAAK